MAKAVTTATRERVDDACPGALRPHHAADGELVRLRLPGGALTAPALRALSHAASDLGDGRIGLTSRGNVQLRGLAPGGLDAFAGRVRAAGLLPSPAHERVRNVVASPLGDVQHVVAALDAALCGRPVLAGLPGRFLFAVDDGSGDVAALGADVTAVAAGPLRGVRFGGFALPAPDLTAGMIAVAEAFLAEREAQGGTAWRIAELAGGAEGIAARLSRARRDAAELPPGTAPEPGVLELDGEHAVCAVVPLGILDAGQAAALAAAAELGDGLRITPWRRVVVRGLALPAALAVRELLAAAGLVTEAGSPWAGLTACAGRPGCASSRTDVHADVRAFADAAGTTPCVPLHWAGCERACGAPAGAVRMIARADGRGYERVVAP